jgi:hypothetical protein
VTSETRVLVALFLSAIPRFAWAAPLPRVHLVFERGPGAERCPDEAALRTQVIDRLGYDPFDPQSTVQLKTSLSLVGRELRAEIELIEASGEVSGSHRLTSRHLDCVELASAVDLALGIAIDPLNAAREGVDNKEARPVARAEPPPRVAAPPTVEEPPRVRAPRFEVDHRRLEGVLGLAAVVANAPTATLGVKLAGAVRFRLWSLGLEARGDLPASTTFGSGHISTALLVFGVVPCFHVSLFRFCAVGDVGAQFASGSDYLVSRSTTVPYFAAGGRVGVDVPIGRRFLLGLSTDVVWVVTQLVLSVDDQVAYRASPVSGVVGVTFGSHTL